MTKRTRLLLAGAVIVLLAFVPGSAGADTVSTGGHRCGGPAKAPPVGTEQAAAQ